MSDCPCCTDARAARWTPAALTTENALLERQINRMERERDELQADLLKALVALERSEQRARTYRSLLRGIIND